MTYGQFLLLFLIPPIFVFGWLRRTSTLRSAVLLLVTLALTAVIYTGPWDNLLIANGVWSFSPDRVLGWTFGRIPVEEFGFYVLQTFATGLFTLWLAAGRR